MTALLPPLARRAGVLAILVTLGAVAPAPAGAATPPSSVLRACVTKKSGAMRLLSTGTKCRKKERLVSWNVTGPAGPAGPAGGAGPAGPAGAAGTAASGGVDGFDGAPAGGALTGTYPNPLLGAGVVGLDALSSALQATQTDARTPKGAAGGGLSGTYPSPTIAADAIGSAQIKPALDDAEAGTPSLRSLGTGAKQAAPGDDPRLSDQRVPKDDSVTGAKVADGSLGLNDIVRFGSVAPVDPGPIAGGGCAGYGIAVPTIDVGSLVSFALPSEIGAQFVVQDRVATADNTVNFYLCNISNAAVDLPLTSVKVFVQN